MYKPRSRKLDLMTKRSLWGWLFVLPFIVGFLVFILSPLYTSLMMSFKETVSVTTGSIMGNMSVDTSQLGSSLLPYGGQAMVDKGLELYEAAFQNTEYLKALTEVATGQLIYIPAILIFSFIVANVLNQQFVGRGAARAIFFMPVVTTTGAAATLFASSWASGQMSNATGSVTADGGLDMVSMLKEALSSIDGLGPFADFITGAFAEISTIITLSGVQILIFLAALQTISPALFEASDVEGATKWEAFWKITFPMVSPMILVNAMYTMIDVLVGQNNKVIKYLFNVKDSSTGLTALTTSQSMAMGWVYFAAAAIVILLVSFIISRFVYNEND